MEDHLERFDRSLVLTEEEEEGVLTLSEEAWTGDTTTEGFLVVGRLLTSRPYRFDVLQMTLDSILRPVRGMTLKFLANNRFLLRFNHKADREKALDGCPWIFDQNLIILNRASAEEDPLQVNLSHSPFNVHIHGLPMPVMNKEIAASIGARLGEGVGTHSLVHVREAADLPLHLRDSSILCGCAARLEAMDKGEEGDQLQYGAWLRESRAIGQFSRMGSGAWGWNGEGVQSGGWYCRDQGDDCRRGLAIFDTGEAGNRRDMGDNWKNDGRAVGRWASPAGELERSTPRSQKSGPENRGYGQEIDRGPKDWDIQRQSETISKRPTSTQIGPCYDIEPILDTKYSNLSQSGLGKESLAATWESDGLDLVKDKQHMEKGKATHDIQPTEN
ncbi:UNVERIFIED_CONTAM: hypothetical protein Slati_1415200 [Sesamum latifolium]|uniref:DUF4283 domain-containing protein n=1 Tax=Sesamum latifolium TaxID=2727402 RepID=A0AAW2X3Y9_9LAMI